ncbi:alpha/beta fold hydrolase [Streptosporangium roseum]|uniref:alpha/beta fold hydrolase n=1 Tax=Streptosporangium roseum TaxID=2001 RepID=UPI003316E1A6
MDWSETRVTAEGAWLCCRMRPGPEPAMVFLHGLAGHLGEWGAAARHFDGRRRVVVFDQRGHGRSERRPKQVSRAAFVADLTAVIRRFAPEGAVLIGQSLGGHTAMLMAAAHPDLVRALVLIEAGPARHPDGRDGIRQWLDSWPTPFPSRSAAAEWFGGTPWAEAWADGLEEHDDGWHPRFDNDLMIEALSELAERDYWAEWDKVSCPTLVIRGESGSMPQAESEEMIRRRPLTRLATISDAGHDLHLDQPAALHTILDVFLNDI